MSQAWKKTPSDIEEGEHQHNDEEWEREGREREVGVRGKKIESTCLDDSVQTFQLSQFRRAFQSAHNMAKFQKAEPD